MAKHAPVIAPTIVRVTLHHDMTNGRTGDCVWDLSVDAGVGHTRADGVQACAELLATKWQEDICPQIKSPVKYLGMDWVDLDSLDAVTGSFGPVAGKPVNSGAAGEPTPPNTAWLIKKHCAHKRQQRTGRCYLPGVDESQCDKAGVMNATITGNMQTAFNNFRSHMSTSGTPVVGYDTALRVVHIKGFDADHFPNEWESSDITALEVSNIVATQRRRLRG